MRFSGVQNDPSFVREEGTLTTQLKLLMLLRVVTVSVVLGVTTYLQVLQKSAYVDLSMILLYVLCGVFYLLTILYIIALKKKFNLWALAYIQLFFDVLFVGGLIYITSGFDIFPFLFVLTIINSSIILGRRGALFMALFSGFVFGTILDLYNFGILPSIGEKNYSLRPEEMVVTIFYNCSAFVIIALLSGSLSEQLQRADRSLKQKQTDLLDLENLNRHIVESLSSGLMTINSDLLVTSFNHAAEEITGMAFAEVFDRPIEKFFPGITECLKGDSQRWEGNFIRTKDEKKLILGFSSSPLRHHSGQFLGRIINFQDVTYVRQMQQQMRESDKLAAIGRLSAGIAHEIRNPLASMSGSIQMLREELKPQGQNRILMDIVTRETERLNVLIREFLEFAKPKESNLEIIPLNDVLLEILAVGRQHVLAESGKSIDLQVDVGTEQLAIKADSGKLKQVLWNLLLNAFQAIQGGTGRVEISLLTQGPLAVVEIRDNGCGIEIKDQHYIFEPFFTTKTQGTGLGLATVRRIVEESGWGITVESEPQVGTTFRVSMPLEKGPRVSAAEPLSKI